MVNLPFPIEERFYRYGRFLETKFGRKTQKVSINTGFSCPNLDGTIDTRGCIYCNNNSFKPSYCDPSLSVTEQINQGISFFLRRNNYQFLAYFQSYTNTHSSPEALFEKLTEALNHPKIVGIVVSTRPDCLPNQILEVLVQVNQHKPVMIEIGVESTLNKTLQWLNRGHSFEQVIETVTRVANLNIDIGVHLILGLPLESREEMINHAQIISKLAITTVKLHQLQIVKHTELEGMFNNSPQMFDFMSAEEYVSLCSDFVERLRPDIAIERFASQVRPDLIAVPTWKGVKSHHITELVKKELARRSSFQGALYND